MKTPLLTNITIAILAGGEGSRMGKPKGELTIAGKPILAYLLDRFQWPGPTLLVTAPGREHPPGSALFSREVSDPIAGEGPLRGLMTALDVIKTAHLIVATVDMPQIGPDQISLLVTEIALRESAMGLMFHSPDDARKVEPFPSIFCREISPQVRERLALKKRSVHSLLEIPGIVSMAWPLEWSEKTWTNLNRPEEFEAWQAHVAG